MAFKSAKGRSAEAASATQGECSAMPPKHSTNKDVVMALTRLRGIISDIRSSVLSEPDTKNPALLIGHAGLIADRHGPGRDRLAMDEIGIAAQIVRAFELHALGRCREGLVRRLCGMAHSAMFLGDGDDRIVRDFRQGSDVLRPG